MVFKTRNTVCRKNDGSFTSKDRCAGLPVVSSKKKKSVKRKATKKRKSTRKKTTKRKTTRKKRRR